MTSYPTLKNALAIALFAALPVSHVWAQTEAIFTKRAAELRREPNDKGAVVTSLPAQAALTKTSLRVGPWIQVKTADGQQTGWVHMFDVGAAASAAPPSNNVATGALRGLSNLFGGGASSRQTTTATSTIGIRGLGAEDIANAQPNLNALGQVEALRLDANGAKRFGAEAALAVRKVDDLPEPSTPRTQGNNKTQPVEVVQ